jgi:hypothetical protein
MYMSAGNAEYSVSTAFTRLYKDKLSPHITDKAACVDSDSLRVRPTDILHEHHHI